MKLIEPANPNGMPRYTKWRLKEMADALTHTALKDIQPGHVRSKPIMATSDEIAYLDSTVSDGQRGEAASGSEDIFDDEIDPVDDFSSDEDMADPSDNDRFADHVIESGSSVGRKTLTKVYGASKSDNEGIGFHPDMGHVPEQIDRDPVRSKNGNIDEMDAKISFLQTQVSMLEVALDEKKLEVSKWEAVADNLKKNNDEIHDEIVRLRTTVAAFNSVRPGEIRASMEVDELKKKMRSELHDKIELRAELRKSEVEIDKLKQANAMLVVELEEARNAVISAKLKVINSEEDRRDGVGRRNQNDHAMDVDVDGVRLGDEPTTFGMCTEGNEEEIEKTTDISCVSEYRTPAPAKPSDTRSMPFVDEQPNWALMSQMVDEDNAGNVREDIPLTYESPSQLQIIDLRTDMHLMKMQENEYLQKLAQKENEIERLKNMLGPQEGVVVALPAQQPMDPAVDVPEVEQCETPESLVAKRTRSRRPYVTPIATNADLDLGKNYRNYLVYRQLHPAAQKVIDELVACRNKSR